MGFPVQVRVGIPFKMARDSSNQKKYDKLGMPFGTANGRLKKNIMFDLVCKLRLNLCFHCKIEIVHVDQFSVEHKTAWLNSDTPIELFFDLNNIAFSHLYCNVEAARLPSMYEDTKDENKERYARVKADPVKYQRKLDNKLRAYHERKGR